MKNSLSIRMDHVFVRADDCNVGGVYAVVPRCTPDCLSAECSNILSVLHISEHSANRVHSKCPSSTSADIFLTSTLVKNRQKGKALQKLSRGLGSSVIRPPGFTPLRPAFDPGTGHRPYV